MASSKISVKINMFYTIISYVDLHLQHHLMSLGIHYPGSGPTNPGTNGSLLTGPIEGKPLYGLV